MTDSVKGLSRALQQFALERDWGQFHSPKNLASALVVEAGELLEHFQWLTEQQSRELPADRRQAVAAEAADVLLYLIQLCTALGIDPIAAAQDKLKVNAQKYPVDKAKGTNKKYDQI
jgi:dCTP diphosphatase